MAVSFYDLSVTSYLQVLGAVSGFMAKGAEHMAQPDNLVDHRLFNDMLPFSFQIRSVVHHSLGTIRGIQEGLFQPPPPVPDMDYAGLRSHLSGAIEQLQAFSVEEINALENAQLKFKAGEAFQFDFTAENFVESFSKPNVFFHATQTYTFLRLQGVPLGKMDFMGAIRAGV